MKQNIEQQFKETLSGYEVPYQEGAWEAFQKQLPTSAPFYKKWWFAASLAVVAIGSILIATSTDRDENKESASNRVAETTTPITVDGKTTSSDNSTLEDNKNITSNSAQQTVDAVPSKNSSSSSSAPSNLNKQVSYTSSSAVNNSNPNGTTNGNMNSGSGNPSMTPTSNDEFKNLNLPSSICLNDDLTIHNPNETKNITIQGVNGKTTSLLPGQHATIKTSDAGTVKVISGKNTDEIVIRSATTKLFIETSEFVYDNGIPALTFDASGSTNGLKWETKIKDKEIKNGTLIVHPYSEQSVTVKASAKDANGCPVEESMTVRMDSKYNLLAPSGFKPLDYDSRNNRFMPFALTQRNTSFELMIINAKNNQVMYQTTDANSGWDGTNKLTGELVEVGSVWIWKVILKNPNPGEPTEYSGTVTRL